MKKLICSAIAILFCVLCVSGVSAFTCDEEAQVSPSGVLNPGEAVTASVNINIPAGTIDSKASVILTTDLEGAIWLYNVYVDNFPQSSNNPGTGKMFSIEGSKLEFEDPVILRIYVTGTVPNAGNAEIKVMSITQTPFPTSGESSYSVLRNTASVASASTPDHVATPTAAGEQTTIPAQPTSVPTESPVSVIATAVGLLGAAIVFSRK